MLTFPVLIDHFRSDYRSRLASFVLICGDKTCELV